MDALLRELFRLEADAPVRPEGRTASILRDLWLGGVPLPRAAAAAGLTVKAAQRTLRSLGLLPVAPVRNTDVGSERNESHPKRPRRNRNAARGDVVRLYQAGRSIRAVAAELGMHQREVWCQLHLAGVPLRPRGTPGVVLSRRALERLYVQEGLPVAEVARRFDVSTDVVKRNIARHGIPRRCRRAALDRDTLRRLYVDERLGMRVVADRARRVARHGAGRTGPPPDPDPAARPASPKYQLRPTTTGDPHENQMSRTVDCHTDPCRRV